MGISSDLVCLECRKYVPLGKRHVDGDELKLTQGVYFSEGTGWVNDGRAWEVIRKFLSEHDGHVLMFGPDIPFSRIALEYESIPDGMDFLRDDNKGEKKAKTAR